MQVLFMTIWPRQAGSIFQRCDICFLLLLQVEKQCKCLINLANLYEIQVGVLA
jgi:hypothetical protein